MSILHRLFGGLTKASVSVVTPAETVECYRQYGFFQNQSTETVLSEAREEWGREPASGRPWDDVFLLRYDKNRVWTGDPEADVCQGNEVYATTLPEWAKITGGIFSPTSIAEKWETEVGPIEISFRFNGKREVLVPTYQDDWIDLEVLLQLNQLLVTSGSRFNCALDGNFCLLLFLPRETEQRLRAERQFPFALP